MEIGGVWLDGEAGEDYSEDMLLEPMLHILQGVSWQEQVRLWDRETDDERYEILYRGRRCFDTLDGLHMSQEAAIQKRAIRSWKNFQTAAR